MTSTTSESIIKALHSICFRLGIPEILISSNGPQYASEAMKNLAKSYTKGSVNVVNVKIGGVVSLDLSIFKEASHCLVPWKVLTLFQRRRCSGSTM